LLLGACSEDTVAAPPQAPTGSLEAIAVPDGGAESVTAKERELPGLYAKAMSSQPPDAGLPFASLGPLLNEDLAKFSSPGMTPAAEPNQIVAAHAAIFGAFDDRKMALGRVWRTPNEQTFEWTMTGTQTRDWRDVAATRKAVTFKGLTLMTTKDDGSITEIGVFVDIALLKAQLTGVPAALQGLPPPAFSAGQQASDQAQPVSDEEQRNVIVVKDWLDALENNNLPAYLAAMTADVEVNTLESATPMSGHAGLTKYFHAVHAGIGDLSTTPANIWGVAHYVVVDYDIDGEQIGKITWLPALAPLPVRTEQLVHFDKVDICEMRDGKIARVWRYDNPGQMLSGYSAAALAAAADAGARAADAGTRSIDAGIRLDAGRDGAK
jgi:ketosteroid isomerase-like protein